MTIPCRWAEGGLDGFAGRVRFRRRFGCPTNLDADERVWLTLDAVADRAELTLNGTPLGGGGGPLAFEVTALLRPRNELVIEVEGGEAGGLCGEVALEVRRTAFLRGLRVEADPGDATAIRVAFEVVGGAGRPLELYVLADRRTAAYAATTPTPEGRPVSFVVPREPAGRSVEVQVDLVGGAEVWYTVRQEVTLGGA
jgi:hypothetical protein